MAGRREDLVDRLPEAEGSVADGDLRRDGETTGLQIDEQLAPSFACIPLALAGLLLVLALCELALCELALPAEALKVTASSSMSRDTTPDKSIAHTTTMIAMIAKMVVRTFPPSDRQSIPHPPSSSEPH